MNGAVSKIIRNSIFFVRTLIKLLIGITWDLDLKKLWFVTVKLSMHLLGRTGRAKIRTACLDSDVVKSKIELKTADD